MNEMKLEFLSRLENEAFARTSTVAFLMPLNPSVEEVMEIKTIIAEAVVNAMIHGYDGHDDGWVRLTVRYDDAGNVEIEVCDDGCGIEDIDLAMQPLYTTKEHLERSGMGMTIMHTFADEFQVDSKTGNGCKVTIRKQLHGQVKQVQ